MVEEEKANNNYDDNINEDIMVSLKTAFTSGLVALKYYFDDDNNDDKVEDIYNIRPLPYIIGTQAFIESPDAGLGGRITEEYYGASPTDNESRVSTEPRQKTKGEWDDDDDDREYTNNDAKQMPKPPAKVSNYYDDDDDDDEDYGSKPSPPPPKSNPRNDLLSQIRKPTYDDDEEEEEDYGSKPTAPKLDVRSALNAQIAKAGGKAGNWDDDEEEEEEVIPRPKEQSNNNNNKPPPPVTKEEDTKGNWDDDEEDNDGGDIFAAGDDDPYSLFGSKPSKRQSFSQKSTLKKDSLSDLFGYADTDSTRDRSDSIVSVDSLFGGKETGKSSVGPKKRASFSGLFGDSNDDSLFGEEVKPKESTPIPVEKPAENPADKPVEKPVEKSVEKKKSSGFDDLFGAVDDDAPFDFGTTSIKPKAAEKPKTGMKALGSSDLFGSDSLFDEPVETKSSLEKADAGKTSAKFASLFGDTNDKLFDDDAGVKGSKQNNTTKPATATSKSSSDLFGDGDDDIFSTKSKPKTSSTNTNKKLGGGLFGDDDDDDLFGSKTTVKAPTPAPAPVAAPAPVITSKAPEPIVTAKSKSVASSLFDDDEDEDDSDIFTKKATKVVSPVSNTTVTKKTTTASSLFDDNEDDDDDFFAKRKFQ